MKRTIRQSTLSFVLHGVAIVMPVLVTALFVYAVGQSNRVIAAIRNQYGVGAATNEFIDSVSYLSRQSRAYATTGDGVYRDFYMEELNKSQTREESLRRLSGMGLDSQVLQIMTGMMLLSNELVAIDADVFSLVTPGRGSEEAINLVYSEEYKLKLLEISEESKLLMNVTEQITGQAVREAFAARSMAVTAVLVMLFASCVFQVSHAILTHRRLIRPMKIITREMHEISRGNLSSELALQEDTSEMGMLVWSINQTKAELKRYIGDLSDKLDAMARGDMSVHSDLEYIGDFAPIRRSLDAILDALNQMLMEIGEASIQISSSARQMSEASQDLASGAQSQAGSITQMNDSIRDITDKTAEDMSFVETARCEIYSAAGNINVSNTKMQDMMRAMSEISGLSADIGDIVKNIDEIAFHTNILAMNASVEAAHAGHAGKGFSVVAEEVRRLSGKSAQAAKDVAALIERNTAAVERGRTIACGTAEALTKVIDNTDDVLRTIDAINENSRYRFEAAESIHEEMQKITDVVQINSATAQENAAAGQELEVQSQALKALACRFHLRGYSRHRPVERETIAAAISRGDELAAQEAAEGQKYSTGFAVR